MHWEPTTSADRQQIDTFEIVGGKELHLKAGTALDFETESFLDVTVEVNDAGLGASPDGEAPLGVNVMDVDELLSRHRSADADRGTDPGDGIVETETEPDESTSTDPTENGMGAAPPPPDSPDERSENVQPQAGMPRQLRLSNASASVVVPDGGIPKRRWMWAE